VFQLHGLPGPTAASPLWQDQEDESGGKQQTTISDVFLSTFSAEACIQESNVLLLICFSKRVRYGDGAGNTIEENPSVFSLI